LIIATLQDYPDEYKPDWGLMSFLVDILRPNTGEGPSWYHLLKKSSGGCSDLLYSGHMLVAVLTAMAWTVCDVFIFPIDQIVNVMCSINPPVPPLLLQLKSIFNWSESSYLGICAQEKKSDRLVHPIYKYHFNTLIPYPPMLPHRKHMGDGAQL
jgi:hypothetical protein